MMKKTRLLRILPAAVAVAALGLTLSAQKSHDASLARNLNNFNSIVKQVELHYVDTINTDQSFKAAIEAFLASTDPYTEYYSADDQEKLQKMTTGEYGGIGSYIMQRNGSSFISQPMEGSPAAKGGLRPGDHIIRVDTTDVEKKESDFVTRLLKGVPGTKVRVTVKRPYVADSIQTFEIMRAKVQEPSMGYDTIINGIGYLRLTSFIDKTPAEVRRVLEKFKEDNGLKGIVIDLRGNGGGLVESAVDLVGCFVPKGTEVVHTIGRDPLQEKIYKTTRKPVFPEIPLAVLIDGGSASASEIVAGSLQDLDRAVLIGSRSFGKGLVQTPVQLPYGGLLKVTVAKYYLPSGRLIQAVDYSHRNADGTVARVPDSLTNVYRTANGREVRDGGGLRPDTTVDWGKINRLVYNIVADNWAFDFATKFAAANPTICQPKDFEITDEIYGDFKKFIDPEKFKYDKVCEELVKQLRTAAETEGYMNDETKAQLDRITELLTHNLDHDLDTHRDEIAEYLGSEIVGRYYYDKGKMAFELKNDKALKLAEEILKDSNLYNKELGIKRK
ncbi:S41 family peptidase [Muribaculaceae bacterium Isolate-113 (HZI)]|nr:S41 family peptidase [Muribaculaceae bacterium Isolate-114 (HZI)]ROT25169.1 S41 family peptidase [Muribaculaceae bacterium Isolate-113 (HZI)]